MHGRILVRMKELDRILNCHDVIKLCFIDQIDNRGKCRTLSTAGRSSYKHNPVLDLNDLFQLFRKIKVGEVRRMHWNYAHHNRVRAPLLKNVHAETRITGNAERKISRASFLKTFDRVLMIPDDHFGDSRGVGWGELLESGNGYGLKFSGQLNLRRATWRKDQI